MARRANTIHPAFLIGFVVLAIVTAVSAMIAKNISDELNLAKEETKKAVEAKTNIEANLLAEKKLRIDQGRFVFGWNQNGDKAVHTVDSLNAWMIEKFPHKISSGATTNEEKIKELLNGQVTVMDYTGSTEEMQAELKAHKDQYDSSLQQAQNEIATLNTQHASRVSELEEEIARKDTELGNMAQRLGERESTIESMRANHSSIVEQKDQQYVDAMFAKNAEISELNLEIKRLKVALDEAQQKLDEGSREKKQQLTPDGEIINIAAAFETRTAYINLGRRDRLSRGLRFEVFQYGPGGVQIKKGEVVVREVKEFTAKVGIVALVNEMDPIVVGDKIANVAYDPKKTFTFGLIGTFENYTKEELKRLIEREGSKVSTKIESGLDYVVIGKFDTEDPLDLENKRYKLAKDFHIQILNEDEIRKYLRDFTN